MDKLVQGILIANDKKDFKMTNGDTCPVNMVSSEMFKELLKGHRDYVSLQTIWFDEELKIYSKLYLAKEGNTTLLYFKEK